MIASVRGQVLSVRLDAVVIEVGGVGMLVQATPDTLAELRPGVAATLFTSLVVREDSLTLFGFVEKDAREVFEVLQTVSGVGPRLALAMLAVHTPDGLRRAVTAQDLTALIKVPGIGRKGAQRIVLELGDRLGPARGTLDLSPGPSRATGPAPVKDQVVEALIGLGWSARAAEEAVDLVGAEEQAPADVAGVLRAALRQLGRA